MLERSMILNFWSLSGPWPEETSNSRLHYDGSCEVRAISLLGT